MSNSDPAWDLFISHANEDKDSFVRPLAAELRRLGLRVWYDEFTLQPGDSISESIDRGLADSRCGLVILSDSFIVKPWPKKELAGLVTLQIERGQLVIPVWYKVSKQDVLAFSPTLADRAAIIATDVPVSEVALKVLELVRPELHQFYLRRLAEEKWFAEAAAEGKFVVDDISDIKLPPIRNETLPIEMLYSFRVVREALLEVLDLDWRTFVDGFRRDMHPDRELLAWLHIAGVYLIVLNEYELSHEERKDLFAKILFATSDPHLWELRDDSPDWERRAFELAGFRDDPTIDSFASGSAISDK